MTLGVIHGNRTSLFGGVGRVMGLKGQRDKSEQVSVARSYSLRYRVITYGRAGNIQGTSDLAELLLGGAFFSRDDCHV